jgi:hypothetical protein
MGNIIQKGKKGREGRENKMIWQVRDKERFLEVGELERKKTEY